MFSLSCRKDLSVDSLHKCMRKLQRKKLSYTDDVRSHCEKQVTQNLHKLVVLNST